MAAEKQQFIPPAARGLPVNMPGAVRMGYPGAVRMGYPAGGR